MPRFQHYFLLLLAFLALGLASCDEDPVIGPADDGSPRLTGLSRNTFVVTEINLGDTLVAIGRNLEQVSAFELLDENGNQDIPFERVGQGTSSFRFFFTMPVFEEGVLASFGQKTFRVTTPGGTADLQVLLNDPAPPGPDTLLITNFDGGGVPKAQPDAWSCYGDSGDSGVKNQNPFDGNYYQIAWEGATDNGFVGCQASIFDAPVNVTQTDAEKVTILFTARGSVDGIVEVILRETDDSNVFLARHKFTQDGWHDVAIPLADFGVGYNPDNQERDMDPTQLVKVQFGIAEWTGVNPTIVNVDDVRVVFELD